ncbi:MAG: peptide MFS transporter [Gammaproteobacteria bacterium]|nr:peptide MFS transporter [Gammaproteobacteria bacterium]
MTDASSPTPPALEGQGHPAGLRTLFFTEMWERMSYYGMRALLVLFMVDAIENGGLGFTDATATAVYGLYTASVYFLTLPGGWIADRLLGAQRTVWFGGVTIMCGHFILAVPSFYAFFIGLAFVSIGTGLLKPNISAIVGELYAHDDPRRDAGFTIFYMGINVGGALGPLICSTLGESERFGWHYGFAAAGVGMLFGLIQFRLSAHRLGEAGLQPSLNRKRPADIPRIRNGWRLVTAGGGIILVTMILLLAEVITVDPKNLAENATTFIAVVAGLYFGGLFAFGNLNRDEKKKLVVIMILFLASAMFWAGFEQAGSSLNLFAERYTDRMVGSFEIPAGWFQTLNPTFIIILAPLFSALWVGLARRQLDPSTPAKFAIGLLLLGAGFAVMIGAAELVVAGNKALPSWLIFTFLLHTMGELALSPVGLSAITKLSPRRYRGQMMGVWFLGSALGLIVAGLLAGELTSDSIETMPALYTQIVLTTAGSGLLLAIFVRPIRRLMGDVR